MARYGYARVSTQDQNLDEQIAQLQRAGCDIIRQEKISGRTTAGREELLILLSFLREGDELWVTRIDRLARSVLDLSNIVADLRRRGVSLHAVQQNIDTSTASGVAFLSMLGVFAEFENEIRRERQMAGIEKAKREGKYVGKGRQPTIQPEAVKQLVKQGLGGSAIAKKLGISRASVYRLAGDDIAAS